MLAASIREAARRFGDRPLLIDAAGRPWSYAEVDARSDAVAVGMARAGVREGDIVALALPSVPEYVVAYLGAVKVGAAAAGVNTRLAPGERVALVDLVDARLVIESADHVDELASTGGHQATPPALADDLSRPVAVVFTSGTTGVPKGAVFDEARIAAICAVDVGLDAWDGGGPMLASTEFCHIGFTTKLAWYLRLGTTQVLMDRWRPEQALRLAAHYRMPALGGVPSQFALMLRSPAFDDTDLGTLSTVTLGGGPASPSLRAEVVERFGAELSVRYSSTESGGCGTGTAFGATDDEALTSEGRPRGPIEVAIRDEAGVSLPSGEIGEVCLRSPTTMLGYWRDPEATTTVFYPDRFLRTGDLGHLDDAGCLYLAGRVKEMYVRGGYNVYPAQVEAVLSHHPQVVDVAVVPRADDVMGEVGVAVVVPIGASPTIDALREFAAPHLAAYKLPEHVVVVDALPLTAMHKLDRRALEVLVAEPPR